MDLPLLLTRGDDPNRFAGYLAELLRMEGINWCVVRDLDRQPLQAGETLPMCVLAGAVRFAHEEAERLARHVREGGSLLAARPDAALAAALGLPAPQPLWPEAGGGYVLLDPADAVVAGLPWVESGVQYRTTAHAYAPAGTPVPGFRTVAWLGPFAGQQTRYPAVLLGERGSAGQTRGSTGYGGDGATGGRVAIIAFDPAACAVRQHQGNPAQASTGNLPDFDGDGTYRPNDLFVGELDPSRRDVPQADLLRTLLIRVLEWLQEPAPIPRLWRFPGGAPAMVFFDGDSDNMSLEDFRLAIHTCDRYGAPFGTYLKTEHVEMLEASEVVDARWRGHSFGPHPWAGPQPTVAAARAALESNCAAIAAKFGFQPQIHRAHWVVWPGWADHARSLASAGICLDASFTAGYSLKGGYVNGTGLPAWFAGDDGHLLGVFEQSTISADDSWLTDKAGLPAMTLAGAISRSCQQIDDAAERFHTVVHPYFHPVLLKGGRALPYPTLPWMEAMLAHTRRRGLPFVDGERWVDWNMARRAVRLAVWSHDAEDAGRAGRQAVTFELRAPAAIDDLTVLVPLPAGATGVEVSAGGEPVPAEAAIVTRHGRRYAAATVSLRSGDARRISVRWCKARR